MLLNVDAFTTIETRCIESVEFSRVRGDRLRITMASGKTHDLRGDDARGFRRYLAEVAQTSSSITPEVATVAAVV